MADFHNRRVIGPHKLEHKICAGPGCEKVVVIGARLQPGVDWHRDADSRYGAWFCSDCHPADLTEVEK